jgi:hypothetical protein
MTVTGAPAYNANTTNNFKVYDYTSTTRETDHFPTVLNWLCIPVQSSWGIDGVNRIPACSNETLATKEIKTTADDFKLFPNPASTTLAFSTNLKIKPLKLILLMQEVLLFQHII